MYRNSNNYLCGAKGIIIKLILNIIQDSYYIKKKYLIFSRFFDYNLKVVKDLNRLKRKQSIKKIKSEFIKTKISELQISNIKEDFELIRRDILEPLNYYYTSFFIKSILDKHNKETAFSFTFILIYKRSYLLKIIFDFH